MRSTRTMSRRSLITWAEMLVWLGSLITISEGLLISMPIFQALLPSQWRLHPKENPVGVWNPMEKPVWRELGPGNWFTGNFHSGIRMSLLVPQGKDMIWWDCVTLLCYDLHWNNILLPNLQILILCNFC